MAFLIPIQILRSHCISASVYMIAGVKVGSYVRVDLRVGPNPRSKDGELGVAESDALRALLSSAIA